jgi:hypothetical protein
VSPSFIKVQLFLPPVISEYCTVWLKKHDNKQTHSGQNALSSILDVPILYLAWKPYILAEFSWLSSALPDKIWYNTPNQYITTFFHCTSQTIENYKTDIRRYEVWITEVIT